MAAAPAGATCVISYDGDPIATGDALVTPTGRTYIVIGVRVQAKGKHAGRQFVRCIVAEGPAPAGVRRFPLIWYRRG